MKGKLLAILKPMPSAVYATDFEDFRLSLFANNNADVMSLRVESTVNGSALSSSPTILTMPKPDCNRCSWCGIWMPLPINPITIVTTDVKEACSTSEPDPISCQLEEVVKAVDELLELSLCQAPCAMGQEIAKIVDEDVGRSMWAHTGTDSLFAAEAPRSREVRLVDDSMGNNKYGFKRTRARAAAEVPEALPNSVSLTPAHALHQVYATDESTGECKSQ